MKGDPRTLIDKVKVKRHRSALLALLAVALIVACSRRDPAPSLSNRRPAPSALEILRAAISSKSFPLPDPFNCAGFDEQREVGLPGRHVMVLSCNRDGLLAAFAADGSLIATHRTIGKPVIVSLFAYDESGQPVDKVLVEEYAWGTGVQTREQVVYRVTDDNIVELWRREVFVRAGGGAVREQYLDGYVLHRRGEYERHGPLLVYGVRSSPHGRYKETVFEIARDTVRPYSGHVE